MTASQRNTQGMPDLQGITELAQLLRENGDKVLSATSKLTLSTTLLCVLNDAFSKIVDETKDMETSFQVCNSSKIDIFRDLKFLHDFVQKTVGLKVTHNASDMMVSVDITKFRHLRYLELQKVSVDILRGLQRVRGQLESVVCSGGAGVGSVGSLLAACGGDAGVGFVWGSLRHLALPYNALVSLDASLELAPWLQTLDLSHNLISSAAELDCLPNLKNVNLGYNKLEALPVFSKPVFQTLQVLVLKSNFIDNLIGLHRLECLSELDLSYNCLVDHSVLWPLEGMRTLLWVSLQGNPLSYHPRHRHLSLRHLHPRVADSKFVLDDIPLSKSEKQLVAENLINMIGLGLYPLLDDIPTFLGSDTSDLMTTPVETSILNESMTKSQSSELLESMEGSITKGRRKRNVKEAVIAESDNEKVQLRKGSNADLESNLEMSMEHLETKKQILALREKFGKDKWLINAGGTFVQDIMGLERTPGPMLSSTPTMTTPKNTPIDVSAYVSPIHLKNSPNFSSESSLEFSVDQKLHENSKNVTSEKEEMNDIDNHNVDNSEELVSQIVEVATDTPECLPIPDEEEGDVYLVQKKKSDGETEASFLILSPNDITEKDWLGKVKCRWAMNTVLSCVMGRGELSTVDIIFDTVRRDRQNRTYFIERDGAKKIVATLSETINARPITLRVFECMKCSTHFSQDADSSATLTSVSVSGFKPPECPSCYSTVVIQRDEISPAETEQSQNIKEKERTDSPKDQLLENQVDLDLQHSESHSSIGKMESEAIVVATSPVHLDFHPQAQVRCSATSLDESRESTPSASTVAKKYESDIEVLSNPSQSSIEVLDENSKTSLTPSRKRSSEERRVAVAPSLITIPDTTPVMPGLTESSSSGSLTDSVCTAYENRTMKHLDANGKTLSKSSIDTEGIGTVAEEKEPASTPVTNLSSMLGELLQSMKIGSSKSSPPKSQDELGFVGSGVQYSYTDFGSLDHRVKLHLILNVFEHEKEELVLLLRAEILMQGLDATFPGCLVLSTSKVYLLRVTGPEGEDPQRWLHKESSWTMDRLRTFAPLPFKQGVLVELHQPGKIGEVPSKMTLLCILQDFQRTSNFLSYLTDLPLPGSCEVEFSVPYHCTSLIHNLLKSSQNGREDESIRLLSLFSCGTLKFENHSFSMKVAGLVVTTSTLMIIEDRLQWLIPGCDELPIIKSEQAMSNLIEVEHNGNSLTLSFLDEVAGAEETWILVFVSAGAAETVINSIQPPWEELFSVPMQVTTKTPQNTPAT